MPARCWACGLKFPALRKETRKQRFIPELQSPKSGFGSFASQGRCQMPWQRRELALEEAPRLWERGREPSSRRDHRSWPERGATAALGSAH